MASKGEIALGIATGSKVGGKVLNKAVNNSNKHRAAKIARKTAAGFARYAEKTGGPRAKK